MAINIKKHLDVQTVANIQMFFYVYRRIVLLYQVSDKFLAVTL